MRTIGLMKTETTNRLLHSTPDSPFFFFTIIIQKKLGAVIVTNLPKTNMREQEEKGLILVKVAKNLASYIAPNSLVMIQNAFRCSNHNMTPLQKGQSFVKSISK